MKLLIASIMLMMTVACGTPKLPDPTIERSKPPAELMKHAENMKTIPTQR